MHVRGRASPLLAQAAAPSRIQPRFFDCCCAIDHVLFRAIELTRVHACRAIMYANMVPAYSYMYLPVVGALYMYSNHVLMQ